MMQKFLIFLLTLLVALVIQSFIWSEFEYVDEYMWTDQVRYIDTKDPRAFNMLAAYGHPGTAMVEIALIAHRVFGVPYNAASNGALALLNAFTIALCTTLCYILRPKSLWYVVVAGLLIPNHLFTNSTPPTSAVSPLIVLLFLLTLYLYERKDKLHTPALMTWGVVAGLSAASRADITSMIAAPLLLFLAPKLRIKSSILIVLVAACTFYIADPFMWTRPLGHLVDLIAKGNLHYSTFTPSHLSLAHLLILSPLATLSIGFALIFLFAHTKLPLAVPRRFLLLMLVITLGISTVFLTASFQAPRYFFPLAFVWEVFLPLFLLSLTETMKAKRITEIAIVTLLVGGQLAMLIHLYLVPEILFICC